MADDDQPTIGKKADHALARRDPCGRPRCPGHWIGVGYGVHSPTTAPAKNDTYRINVGNLPTGKRTCPLKVRSRPSGKGAWQHFYEYFSTNPTTRAWRLSASTSASALSAR